MADERLFIAVDLGAGSGRVFVGRLGDAELSLDEVRRFQYPPRVHGGHLRWDFTRILDEVTRGLAAAADHARTLGRPIASLGIDSWAVDYGLVDEAGRLLDDPVCYRDGRTAGVMDRVFRRVPRDEIFARTGIQFMPFNTIYQLAAHVAEGLPGGAARLLLMPDLIASMLTGRAVTEYTNGTTTQMLNAATGDWDDDLLSRLELPRHLLCDIVGTGSRLGPLDRDAAAATGLSDVPLVATATHDTASAVAGAPLDDGWSYISSGTWSLVGVERDRPLIDAAVGRHNFTNEGGAFGTTRFLKNVMGLWILERCRAEWQDRGDDVEYAGLIDAVAHLDGPGAVVFPDDPRFLNPPSMLAALATQLAETGQPMPLDPAGVTKVILDSLALRYASVLRSIETLTARPVAGIRIVGGGSRNDYLNQATATASGRQVAAGPVESTVIGNVLVQAIAAGRFPSLAAARRHVAAYARATAFMPAPTPAWTRAAEHYDAIEARYLTP